MKKFLALMLALLMVLTVFCSCNNGKTVDTDTDTESDTSAPVKDTEKESESDTEKAPWKPGDSTDDTDDTDDTEEPPLELGLPLEAPNGKTMNIVSVMDGTWTKPFDAEASAWVSESTDKAISIFDNNGTVNLNEYSGFLVRVKPNEENNGIYLRFFLKMQDGTEIEVKASGRNLYWYTAENGWATIASGATASNWKLPIAEEGYAYLEFPLAEVTAHTTPVVTDIKVGSYATSRSATFSEWSLVKGTATLTKPTTLADNTKIEIVPISDGTYTKDFTNKDQRYASALENATTNMFVGGATIDLSQYRGFLVKKTPENENGKGIYIRFKVKYTDGTEVEIKAQNRELGWFNGSWGTATTATSNWKFALDDEGYAFLDFTKFEELNNKVIMDFCIYNSEADRSAKFSEWSFVKAIGGGDVAPEVPEVVKPEMPVLAAPTTLADGTPIALTPITDGWFVKDPAASAGCWATLATGATTSIFKDGATVDLANYKGFMVRKAPNTEGGGIYIRFKFKVVKADGTTEDVEMKALGRSLYYYTGNEWTTIVPKETDTNWKVTPVDTDGYLFIEFPFAELTEKGTVVSDIYIYSSSGSRSAIFADWCLVKETIAAPTALADGTAITLTPITDGIIEAQGSSVGKFATEFQNKTTSIFDNGAKVNLSEYKGILVKVTTTTETHNGLYVRFKFKTLDGTDVEVKAKSRAFYWYNGETWEEKTGAASNWTTPNEAEGYAYFAFPFEELTSTEVMDIYLYSSGSATRTGVFSEFCLVK